MTIALWTLGGLLVAIAYDWALFDKMMLGARAVWARKDDYAYRNYLGPRRGLIAMSGALVGCGAAMDYRPLVMIGAALFVLCHLCLWIMVCREYHQPD